MEAVEYVCARLPSRIAAAVRERAAVLTEVRLRPGGRPQMCFARGDELLPGRLEAGEFARIAARMLDHSLYAWEDELRQGFFTLPGGWRVGVCGRYARDGGEGLGSLAHIAAICVRVAREVRGAGDELVAALRVDGAVKSALVLSRPGLGKTTLLRDAARQLSDAGATVALADERGELAACRMGIPTLDVGARTDVMDLCPKHLAIAHLVRALRPEVVVTDEVGDARDAEAVLDARRAGAAVLASAHAGSIEEAARRPALARMLAGGAFDLVVLIDGGLGRIARIQAWGDGA